MAAAWHRHLLLHLIVTQLCDPCRVRMQVKAVPRSGGHSYEGYGVQDNAILVVGPSRPALDCHWRMLALLLGLLAYSSSCAVPLFSHALPA